MVFLLAIGVTAGAVLGGVYLLKSVTTNDNYHWFAAAVVSLVLGVGGFLLSLLIIDVIAGIGRMLRLGNFELIPH